MNLLFQQAPGDPSTFNTKCVSARKPLNKLIDGDDDEDDDEDPDECRSHNYFFACLPTICMTKHRFKGAVLVPK